MRRTPVGLVVLALATLLTSCGVAHPWPGAVVLPPAVHNVLMIGDSLVGQTDSVLPEVLDRESVNANVIDAHVNGSGLLGPVGDAPTALDWVQEKVAAFPYVDTVVVEWGGACAVACDPTVADHVTYGSPEFYAQWTANAHAVIDYLLAQGKTVVWAVTPPFGVDTSSLQVAVAQELSNQERADFSVRAGGGSADWFTALTDLLGRFSATLSYDGYVHEVRTPDLVHFTADGAFRASVWTVKGLTDLWAAHPAVTGTRHGVGSAGTVPRLIEAGDPVTLDVGRGL